MCHAAVSATGVTHRGDPPGSPIGGQAQRGAQAGGSVLQAQRAAVQMCDGLDQSEAEAGARRAARRFAAEEALGGTGAILWRNARALVGHGDLDAGWLGGGG